MTAPTYYRPYGFTKAIVQLLGDVINGDSATTTFTADNPHGLAVGDIIYVTDLGGGSGASLLTRYYVKTAPSPTTATFSTTAGGSAVSLGSSTDMKIVPIVEVPFALPQKAAISPENTEITWEGGDQKLKQTNLDGMSIALDLDAVQSGAHATLFSKSAITGLLPGGLSSAVGYGGGDDKRGVACGLRLEGPAWKNVNGVETAVTFARWFPQGNLTFTKPSEFNTSNKAGQTGYSFTPIRTAVDVGGAAITGASAGGEFYYDGEI